MDFKRKLLMGCSIIVVAAVTFAAADVVAKWKSDFQFNGKKDEKILPKGWEKKTKIGTDAADFYLVKDEKDNLTYLHMEANKATASVICSPEKIKIKETPVIKWKWRVNTLPTGADGRVEAKDDQAIGIYVGSGSMFSKKSISYRWDTETPKGAEGTCAYGAGTIKIKWFTLRNKDDATGEWFTEERNVAEDFNKAWGYYPDEIYISVSCNSQYTGTKASADLNWIEILPLSGEQKK